MRTQDLPTWDDIRANATAALTASHRTASDAADWLRSDRRPNSPVPETVGDARAEVFELIGQIKELTDRAKDTLNRTRDEQSLLEQTGGHVAECDACSAPIDASAGYGARCDSCEQEQETQH